MLLSSRARPVRERDNFAAIYVPIVGTMWDPHISQPYRPPKPVTEINLLFYM
jgi:hypothetical protein